MSAHKEKEEPYWFWIMKVKGHSY